MKSLGFPDAVIDEHLKEVKRRQAENLEARLTKKRQRDEERKKLNDEAKQQARKERRLEAGADGMGHKRVG